MDSPGHISTATVAHPTLIDVQTIRLLPDSSRLMMLTAAPGLKWNLTDTWVLVANVGIPLTQGGLTTAFTPFVGVDYAISR
jgi:hypothetical protein